MSSVLDQAQNVGGVVSAARLRERWQQQEVKTGDPERREQLREAIADLEFRFPELEDIPAGGAEAFAKERGHGSKSRSPVHEGRRRAGAAKAPAAKPKTSRDAGSKPSGKGGAKSTPAPPARGTRGRRRRSSAPAFLAGAGVGRYSSRGLYRETGIPGATWSATSITMSLLGMTVGLSLLYLMLVSAERGGSGARAFPHLLGAITGFVQRFVSTRDILGDGGAAGGAIAGMPTYNDRILSGEVAGPLNPQALVESLPELPQLPKRGQKVTPLFPRISSKPRRRRPRPRR